MHMRADTESGKYNKWMHMRADAESGKLINMLMRSDTELGNYVCQYVWELKIYKIYQYCRYCTYIRTYTELAKYGCTIQYIYTVDDTISGIKFT